MRLLSFLYFGPVYRFDSIKSAEFPLDQVYKVRSYRLRLFGIRLTTASLEMHPEATVEKTTAHKEEHRFEQNLNKTFQTK
jgi:hypothetical protein